MSGYAEVPMLIILPATVAQLNAQVLDPLFALALMKPYDSPEARVMLLAISPQEAGGQGVVRYRQQINGPAHGLWQNEEGGMVKGVLTNLGSRAFALCQAFSVSPTPAAVYAALLVNDVFAAGVARLGLLADPFPLPALGDQDDAWLCYQKNWGPGKPRPNDWDSNYQPALQVISPC